MTAPVLTSISTGGDVSTPTVFCFYNQTLSATNVPVAGDFAVKLDGVAKTVSSITMGSNYVRLNMGEPIPAYYNVTNTVTVSYTDPGGATGTQNAGGEHAATFTNHAVDTPGVDNCDAAYPTHVYEGAAGTIELPKILGGRYETADTTVRAVVSRGTIPATGMHAWVYVDGVAHTDIWGAITAGFYGDTSTVSITGLSEAVHTIDVFLIGADGIIYEEASYRWVPGQGSAIAWPVSVVNTTPDSGQFLLDNFVGADDTVLVGSHTGEAGATWAWSAQSLVYAGNFGNHKIYEGAAYQSSSASNSNRFSYPSANPSSQNFHYELDVRLWSGATAMIPSSAYVHLYLCLDNAAVTYYNFQLGFVTVSGVPKLRLVHSAKRNGTVIEGPTTESDFALTLGTTHTVRLDFDTIAGWTLKVNGTLVASGSTYITPAAAENLLVRLAGSTTDRRITLDAVRGYDDAPPTVYEVTSMDPISFGEPTIVAAMVSMEPVTWGQPTVAIPTHRVKAGIKPVVFGKPIGPNNALRRVKKGMSPVRWGLATAYPPA